MYLKFCGMSEATLHAEGDVGELWWSVYWLRYLSNLGNGCSCSCSLLSTWPVNAHNHSCFREWLKSCVDEDYNDIPTEVFCQSQEILYLSIKVNHEKRKKNEKSKPLKRNLLCNYKKKKTRTHKTQAGNCGYSVGTSVKFIINLSIWTFIPFLLQNSFSSRLRNI